MPIAPPPLADVPLNALRALDAALRCGGFAAAASELGVSPAAITAHVKGIEERLGLRLFDRTPQGVVPTDAAGRVRPALEAAFDALEHAQAVLRHEARPLRLSIAALPALAQLWLAPRLGEIEGDMPHLRVSITAMERAPKEMRGGFDVALFMDATGRDALVPVAAPGQADAPRLTDSAWARDWATWSKAGHDLPGTGAGAEHSLYALAVGEALAGRGILMGRWSLVEPLVRDGRLVPVGPRVPIDVGPVAVPCNRAKDSLNVARWLNARIAGDSGPSRR